MTELSLIWQVENLVTNPLCVHASNKHLNGHLMCSKKQTLTFLRSFALSEKLSNKVVWANQFVKKIGSATLQSSKTHWNLRHCNLFCSVALEHWFSTAKISTQQFLQINVFWIMAMQFQADSIFKQCLNNLSCCIALFWQAFGHKLTSHNKSTDWKQNWNGRELVGKNAEEDKVSLLLGGWCFSVVDFVLVCFVIFATCEMPLALLVITFVCRDVRDTRRDKEPKTKQDETISRPNHLRKLKLKQKRSHFE